MTRVRAVVFPRRGARAELVELPEPDLEPGSALLRVECSEVCGTDLHLQKGLLQGVPYPLIPGHVTVGRLEKVRGPLADVHGQELVEGERVTFLDVHRTCHACWYCLVAKATTRCPARKVYGITYGAADGLCGGWAEKVYLKPGTRVIRLGDARPEAFMAGGCALPTALHAIERARIAVGDAVLVLGAGPVGLSIAILARLSGAAKVLVVGAPAARLAAAREAGASATLDFTGASREERAAWVRARTEGRGADVVLEAAGAPDAVVDAMRMARDAGRVVVVGQYTDHGETVFSPHGDLNKKHLEVLGCWGSDYSHFHRAVLVACSPDLGAAWGKLPLAEFGLAQANEALAAVAGGRVVKALIRP
jgi:L-iditol 2-dehydrogenase